MSEDETHYYWKSVRKTQLKNPVMAEDETQMQHEEPSLASNPMNGACTRWCQLLLRGILLTKNRSNPQGRRHIEEPQVKKHYIWYWLLILVFCGLGLGWERYTNSRAPNSQQDGYCNRSKRLGDMVTHVRHQVMHQEEALDLLERALDNATYRNIALVGSSGVGKSHTARSLRQHFPWPENVKTLSWQENPSLLRVQSMLKNILLCGQNLILIDDLKPLNGHLVPIINELIRGRREIAKGSSSSHKSKSDPHLKQLTSIFMFTVDRQQPEEIYKAEIEALKKLPETHVIIYATLESSQLRDCKNLSGSKELQQDTATVTVSGCKFSIAQKVVTTEEAYQQAFNFLY